MKRILIAVLILLLGFFVSPWLLVALLLPLFYFFPFFYEGMFAWYILDLARAPTHAPVSQIFIVTIILVVVMHGIELIRPSLRIHV